VADSDPSVVTLHPKAKDATGAMRARRFRKRKARAAVTSPVTPAVTPTSPNGAVRQQGKRNNIKDDVTVVQATNERRLGAADVAAYGAAIGLGRYVAAALLGAVGIGLSAIGMVETASYSLAAGGLLFCALAIAADVLTLVMPATIGALWCQRSPAVALAVLLWCSGAAVTVANLAGYVGEHVDEYQNGRQTMVTGRDMAMERLARLRGERKAINETRPSAAILAAMAGARRSEQPQLREALAMARRRDALDLELAAFEKRLTEIPQVATADASAAVLSEIGGTAISEVELRRFRLALLLGLPLCGGLVLSLAFALAAASTRRIATA
jgi:hypothetical protein